MKSNIKYLRLNPEFESKRMEGIRRYLESRKKDSIKVACKICGKSFYAYKTQNRKYCSRKCFHSDKKRYSLMASMHRGYIQSEEAKIKMSESKKRMFLNGFKIKISEEICIARGLKRRGRPNTTELTKKGPTNCRSKWFSFRDPTGKVLRFKNIKHFIRENSHLFLEEDVVEKEYVRNSGKFIKKTPSKQSSRAANGLYAIHSGGYGSWKGWTKYSVVEDKLNYGNDLLSRTIKNSVEKQSKEGEV